MLNRPSRLDLPVTAFLDDDTTSQNGGEVGVDLLVIDQDACVALILIPLQ